MASLAASSLEPNQTLYINNLSTKIKKPELKRLLYAMFSPYGQIIDLVALKTAKCRGQAFIVFKEVASAVAAMRSLQGYPFFEKGLRIQFAKTQSKAAQRMEIVMRGGVIQYGKTSREEFSLLTLTLSLFVERAKNSNVVDWETEEEEEEE